MEERGKTILDDSTSYCLDKSVTPKSKHITGIIPNIIAEESKKVDLVIIAQRGEHEKWSTGLLGSTTESVVRKAPRPVLVTPNQFTEIKNVLVAYDGGNESNRALKTSCELCNSLKCSMGVIIVTDDEDRSLSLTAEVKEFAGPYCLNEHIETLDGEAAKVILQYAENNRCDLIVMGAFSHGRIYDLILGGTTAYIIRQSTIPVLLNR